MRAAQSASSSSALFGSLLFLAHGHDGKLGISPGFSRILGVSDGGAQSVVAQGRDAKSGIAAAGSPSRPE